MNVLKEVEDHLKDEDPAEVCYILNISAADLVERFNDRIEDNLEELKDTLIPEYDYVETEEQDI